MIYSLDEHKPEIDPSAFIHGTAEVSGRVILKARVSIWPYAILRGDVEPIEIGEDSNIQDACVFHTSHGLPVILGKGVTVGHGAIVHGCRVGDTSLIGMGAILLDGGSLGSGGIVGAGAVVPEGFQVPSGHLAVGVPARVVRPLKTEEVQMIHKRALDYVAYAERYRRAKKVAWEDGRI